MQSESAIENRAQVRGRRRKRGNGSVDGPVFVDNSGRRARLLRRIGMLVGVVCLGYAVVLGMAFMGWGTSLTPSSLFPFGGGQAGSAPGGGGNLQPQGGIAPTGRPTGIAPTGRPTGTAPSGVPTGAAPSSAPTTTAAASASTGTN
ncbi:hypothetical protein GCM10011579_077570 [Streptomyces albiflavescens]|uniref:Uncharacterized protein n=1 Tax=Streptomyces albiflavescens TaxID=1623582 RepID=A0A917YDP3_9ACTN|nr:hypothetical protein [Streptomyces albiflavescens]GGN86097.1 hypothetical protein GCM10011579_077570 [Streptomyces albiflavescens]